MRGPGPGLHADYASHENLLMISGILDPCCETLIQLTQNKTHFGGVGGWCSDLQVIQHFLHQPCQITLQRKEECENAFSVFEMNCYARPTSLLLPRSVRPIQNISELNLLGILMTCIVIAWNIAWIIDDVDRIYRVGSGGGMSATKNEKCCFPYLVAYAGPARLLPSLP